MITLVRVRHAEMVRDGGSLVAEFELPDGLSWSYGLWIAIEGDAAVGYRELLEGSCDHDEVHGEGVPVERGSRREAEIVEELRAWLAGREVAERDINDPVWLVGALVREIPCRRPALP